MHMTKDSHTTTSTDNYTLALTSGNIYNIQVQPILKNQKRFNSHLRQNGGMWLDVQALLLVEAHPKMYQCACHPQGWGSENLGLNNRENKSQ